jgi:hypothetical protein
VTEEQFLAEALDDPVPELLDKLCVMLSVPAADCERVRTTRSFMLGSAAITLTYEAWSHFVKAHVEIGLPAPAHAGLVHRFLLAEQLRQPAPFVWTLGIHADTDRAFLCCAVPFPDDEAATESFIEMLKACVQAREVLRDAAPDGVVWE